jgi:hypothetical protein
VAIVSGAVPSPGIFNITAVQEDQVVVAMRDSGMSEDIVRNAWSNLAADIQLSNLALPPVYFHGLEKDPAKGDDAGRFVYGLVYLSNDNPPVLHWIVAFQSYSRDIGGMVIVGVQVGGCASRRGILGVSYLFSFPTFLIPFANALSGVGNLAATRQNPIKPC